MDVLSLISKYWFKTLMIYAIFTILLEMTILKKKENKDKIIRYIRTIPFTIILIIYICSLLIK